MYAVVKTGGSQYRVRVGDHLKVERLSAEAGTTIELNQVLMIEEDGQARVGTPLLEDVQVLALVRGHSKGERIRIIKMHRRKHHMKRQGHRQPCTELTITEIRSGSTGA